MSGKRIQHRHLLHDGDVLEYGDYRLEFRDGPPDRSPAAPAA